MSFLLSMQFSLWRQKEQMCFYLSCFSVLCWSAIFFVYICLVVCNNKYCWDFEFITCIWCIIGYVFLNMYFSSWVKFKRYLSNCNVFFDILTLSMSQIYIPAIQDIYAPWTGIEPVYPIDYPTCAKGGDLWTQEGSITPPMHRLQPYQGRRRRTPDFHSFHLLFRFS